MNILLDAAGVPIVIGGFIVILFAGFIGVVMLLITVINRIEKKTINKEKEELDDIEKGE